MNITFGNIYNQNQTEFKAYITKADAVQLVLFDNASSHTLHYVDMNGADDIWSVCVEGDLKGRFYSYRIKRGSIYYMSSDPYAFACSVNGKRSCVVDLAEVDELELNLGHIDIGIERAVLYETHIRDFTMATSDLVTQKGKYLGVIQGENEDDRLGYLTKLGISHIHFLPLQDFGSVDENDQAQYNWGYDPMQYYIPEGSYASDPSDPKSRIKDMRAMVDQIHKRGLGVVLDVVYNHTYFAEGHPFEILAPGIYFRMTDQNKYSNGSGCGNELNSEHPIVRGMIISSLKHWMNYYGFDGFRFDLMALIDTETMQIIAKQLRLDYPNIILYGEPWLADLSVLSEEKRMLKGQQKNIGIALFNDDYRSLLKGDSDGDVIGYIQGDVSKLHHVKTGFAGSIEYSEEHYSFTAHPHESINYISAHDNLSLRDKLSKITGLSDNEKVEMTKLGFATILLAFGVPFIHGGSEIGLTKSMDHNSYRSGDEVNSIKWSSLNTQIELYNWVASLTAFRRSMPCYQTYTSDMIKNHVTFAEHKAILAVQIEQPNMQLAYTMILINGANDPQVIDLRIKGSMKVLLQSHNRPTNLSDHIELQSREVLVLQQKKAFISKPEVSENIDCVNESQSNDKVNI